ncbi:MAG: Zn-dependent hydrolase [Methylobacteriaceae bacterium]|nr:Zn-dependent hydrolase [Methylobacteriaceae bacterium]
MTDDPRAARLMQDLARLADIGVDPAGGWTRRAFSPADVEAHDWFCGRAREAGLEVRFDAFGNVVARREGRAGPGAPALVMGSHLDTVPNGGPLDGALGVLAGLEVARRLIETDAIGMRAIEVVAFRDEEGRFGSLPGSRAMSGRLSAEEVARLKSADGVALAAAMAAAGFDPARVGEAARPPGAIAAYLELHIEQGPVLEAAGRPVGIVTAIAGQTRWRFDFQGAPDHAGTTPMGMRRDAFAAAARFADRFRDMILAEGGAHTRGTIGFLKLTPNAGNVVPGRVQLGLEIRDVEAGRPQALGDRAVALAEAIAPQFGVSVAAARLNAAPTVAMDAGLAALLTGAARDCGCEPLSLPSGAGHDAGIIAAVAPAAMLFAPSIGGRSHCPEEATDHRDVAVALAVLERAMRRLCAVP